MLLLSTAGWSFWQDLCAWAIVALLTTSHAHPLLSRFYVPVPYLRLDASSDDGAAAAPKVSPKTAKAAAAAAPPPAYGRKRFEDEDAEDEVKDDWDAEEEEPEKPDVSNLQPIKKKGTFKQKIKEREEQDRRRAELGLGSDDDVDDEDEDEDPAERRRREKEAQIKADVENAASLLGTSKISADEGINSLRSAKPQSKEDWEKFSNELFSTLVKGQAGRTGFDKHFVPHFCKLMAEGLRDVDCRKQSTDWKRIADDKTKAEKEKKLGGAKRKTDKPKQVGTASAKNVYDTRACESRGMRGVLRSSAHAPCFPVLMLAYNTLVRLLYSPADGDEALDDGDDLDFM